MLKQIGINSFWLFLSRVLAQLLQLIFIGIIARTLGVQSFGSYILFALILFIGNIFTAYGTDALLIREISRERKISASFSASAWLQILLSFLWLVTLFLCTLILKFDSQTRISLLILNLSLIPLSFQSVFNSLLRAFERMDIYSTLNVFAIFVQTALVFLFIENSEDLLLLCILLFLNQTFIAIISYFVCKRVVSEFKSIEKPLFSEIINILLTGWRLAIFFPLSAFHQRLNLFVLSFLSGQEVTGLFSAPTRLMDGMKLAHFSVSNGIMPSMAKPATPEIKSTLQTSLLLLLAWSIIAGIAIFIFADLLINLIYGFAYSESIPALKIVGFVLIPYTFSVYYSLQLIMAGKENLVLRITVLSLLLTIILHVYLITNFGLSGAAWGTLINEIIFASLLLIGSRAIK
jgi:O-antigen/teichoic acid export membrane protein